MSKTTVAQAIRLTITPEVALALAAAKKQYPALSDPEILKVGLSRIAVTDSGLGAVEIRQLAARAVGEDYLNDPAEDMYQRGAGKPTRF